MVSSSFFSWLFIIRPQDPFTSQLPMLVQLSRIFCCLFLSTITKMEITTPTSQLLNESLIKVNILKQIK